MTFTMFFQTFRGR